MDWLAQSKIFDDKLDAIKAAIDFWVIRYRNLCVLNALKSLPFFKTKINQIQKGTTITRKSYSIYGLPETPEEIEDALKGSWMLREFYQGSEDKFFEI